MLDPEPLRCSFCGKTEDQIRKLVFGPGVYICNECVRPLRRNYQG